MEQIFMHCDNFDRFQCSYATISMPTALGNRQKKTISDIISQHRVSMISIKSNWFELKLSELINLTHFQPMLHLRINQAVAFYKQNVLKASVEERHFK